MTFVAVTARDGARWSIAPGWVDRLAASGDVLAGPRVRGQAVLRETASRRVVRVDLDVGGGDALAVLVKTYRARSAAEALWRRLAGRTPAEIERDGALLLRRLGFRVPEPIATSRSPGLFIFEATLVTAFEPGARTLVEIARDPGTDPRRFRALSDALAALLADLHAKGVVHEDLHLGNFLAREAGDDLVMIDVRRVRGGVAVSVEHRVAALAAAYVAAFGLATRSAQLRFLARYARRAGLRAQARALGRDAALLGQAHVEAQARRRARSAVRGDARFARVCVGGARWIVRRDADGPGLRALLEGGLIASDRYDVVDAGGSARARLEQAVLDEGLGRLGPRVVAAGLDGARSGVLVIDRGSSSSPLPS